MIEREKTQGERERTQSERVHINRPPLAWLLTAVLVLTIVLPAFGLVNAYLQQVFMYIGINIILVAGLNLINGYMGEFSVGHAAFMGIGAYVSAILTVWVIPRAQAVIAFPFVLIAGGLAAALAGFLVSVPSFKTRGDYLAIVTLAFNMIVKSALENIDAVGGPRGFLGIDKLTSMAWVYVWVVITIFCIRNIVYSNYGRGVMSIREDEIAAELVTVNTRQCKVIAFVMAAFFAGVAGGLYAHLLQFINPRSFALFPKSTEILAMVYLGGVGSLGGSILGATIFTVTLEVLRPLGVWRWVATPLCLVLLMIFRPRGIMGLREWKYLVPQAERTQPVKEVGSSAAS
ncbi:MAG: branched-chain amino acid ABC transporter permease [Bacillota bacterium]